MALHPIPIQSCPCYEDVVCFIGAFVGVAMGNWRTNNFYYADMHQLDALWRWVMTGVSPGWQYRSRMMWTIAVVHRPAVRLCVASAFAIVPTRPVEDSGYANRQDIRTGDVPRSGASKFSGTEA